MVLDCPLDSSSGSMQPASVRVASAAQHHQLLQGAEDQLLAAVQV